MKHSFLLAASVQRFNAPQEKRQDDETPLLYYRLRHGRNSNNNMVELFNDIDDQTGTGRLEENKMAGHDKLLLGFMIAVVVMMVLTFTFNGLSATGDPPLYLNNTGAISDKYDAGITPAGWTFSIWGVIYVWQSLFVVFAFYTVFKKTDEGPAYTNPNILTLPLFVTYLTNLCINIGWTLAFGNESLIAAFVLLFLIAFTLYICMFFSYRSFAEHSPKLAKEGRNLEIWCHRIIVHNAFGIYATWTTIATLLNVIIVMVYVADPGVELETAGTVALGILTAEIIVFAGTDLILLDKYSRYTFTPYLVVMVALGGSISKNYDSAKTNSIFTVVLLAIGCVLAVVKLIVMLWRHFKTPMFNMIEPTGYTLKA